MEGLEVWLMGTSTAMRFVDWKAMEVRSESMSKHNHPNEKTFGEGYEGQNMQG